MFLNLKNQTEATCPPAPQIKKKQTKKQSKPTNPTSRQKTSPAQLMFHFLEKFPVFISTGANSSDVFSLVNESNQILKGQKVQ